MLFLVIDYFYRVFNLKPYIQIGITYKWRLNLKCPNCGKEVMAEGASFCPYCAKDLKATPKNASPEKRSSSAMTALPVTSGILTILASCLALTTGIICIIEALSTYGIGYGYGYIGGVNILLWITGIFGIIAFPISLIGGIFSFRKRHIAFPIFGTSLLITAGVLLLVLNATDVLTSMSIWIYGLILMILSILSVIFVATAKNAFS